MMDEATLNQRLNTFIQEIAKEAGQTPGAAILAIHWGRNTTMHVCMAPLPKETMFSMVSTMSRSLVSHLESLRAKLRTYKAPTVS
jgi:hypothetical protein